MKKNYDAQMKESIAKRCLDGERVPIVALEMGVPRSTLYAWVSKMKAELAEQERLCFENKALDPREYFKQKERIAKLEGMLAVIKAASGVMDMPLAEKLRVLDEFYHDEKYSVRLMCEALEYREEHSTTTSIGARRGILYLLDAEKTYGKRSWQYIMTATRYLGRQRLLRY